MAELCALLSALSGAPVRQFLAMTGSVDQNGQSQAIGGVNEKIEGFFDVCRRRGMKGGEGVIIPVTNVKHLMLRADVVEAVAQGAFQVHAVDNVDEAIEILTGDQAGTLDESGRYPKGSINVGCSGWLPRGAASARARWMAPGRAREWMAAAMEADRAGFVINRVVIALDSVCEYLAPIEAAADLALRFHAELHGVFVEDIGLLRMADLPFTRQVSLGREPTRPLERDAIEAEFRALARQARHCLERIGLPANPMV
jgi:hypothetical protein